MASPSVTKFNDYIDSLLLPEITKDDIKKHAWVFYVDMVHEYGEHLKFYIEQEKQQNAGDSEKVARADSLISAANKISSGDHPVKQVADAIGGE